MKNTSRYIAIFALALVAPVLASAATILFPSGGGTGISTAPTYGQVLVGNSSGTYTLTATSSLGISGGSGVAYPFPDSGNATSTLTQFNGGLTAFASTTIGAGGQTTGLTINGGATTTLAHYFATNIGIGSTTPGARIGVTHTTNSLVPLLTATGFDNDNAWAPVGLFNESGTPSFVLYMPGVLNSTGNIGLGTSTPQSRLTVDHNSTVGTTPNGILINDSDVGTTWSTTVPGVVLDFGSNDTSGTGYGTRIRLGSVMEAASGASSRLGIFTAPTTAGTMVERLSVLSNGNVGIGSTTPAAALSIVQPDGATPGFLLQGFANNTRPVLQVIGGNSPNTDLVSVASNANSSYFVVNSVGSVGFGTSSPYGRFSITNTTAAPSFIVEDSASPDTSPFIITEAGAVAIGTTTAANSGTKLHVYQGSSGGATAPTNADTVLIEDSATPGLTFLGPDAQTQRISFSTPSRQSGGIISYDYATTLMGIGTNVTGGTLVFNSGANAERMRITSNGNVGIGTTTPWAKLSVEGLSSLGNQAIAGYFTATSTTASSFAGGFTAYASSTIGAGTQSTGLTVFGGATTTLNHYFASNVGIASTSPAFPLSVNNTGSDFYVTSTGKVVGQDTANSFTGRISPTHQLALQTGTTTTWTASTTGTAYSPYVVAPFSGTVKQIYCATDTSFLGVNIQVASSNVTPSYFVASTTVGNVAITAGNTFTKGQKILANFGTTTTASAQSISCTLDITETP